MRELALHLMDIAENSVGGQAKNISIFVEENINDDFLVMKIVDDGKGMDADFLANVVNPFTTTRTTRKVGLGIPLLKEACEASNGTFTIKSSVGKGTSVEAKFQHSHIDRMPLGDVANTLFCLVISYPQIHWVFEYKVNGEVFKFDDQPIKRELDGVPLSEPGVLGFIREYLTEGVNCIQPKLV